jgi:hypothetical protein
MKRIHSLNQKETDNCQAEIYPDSKCCLREKHDIESSNLDAQEKSGQNEEESCQPM